MRITSLMSEALVLPEIQSVSRDEALREIVDHLVAHAEVELQAQLVFDRLLARERLASTAVGHGMAIPHAKLPGIADAIACIGRSSAGVEFGAKDGSSTRILLTIVAPEGNAGMHLKALARASRLLMDASFRRELLEAPDAVRMWSVIVAHDEGLST